MTITRQGIYIPSSVFPPDILKENKTKQNKKDNIKREINE